MRLLIRSLLVLFTAAVALSAAPETRIDWPSFLARQDLVWSKVPTAWEDGAFIGNGNLGANIFTQDGALAWEVNRTDVYHNGSSGAQRYQMGHVALKTAGAITGGDVRLDLWNAEARGTLRTDRGEVRWRSFTATKPAAILIEVEGTGGEADVTAEWIAAEPRPPRETYQKQKRIPSDLQHPAPRVERTPTRTVSVQQFNGGRAFAVALERAPAAGDKQRYLVSVGYADTADAALTEATAASGQAAALPIDQLAAEHRA